MTHGGVIDHAKLEGAVVQTIKDWATANPGDLVAFDKQMKQLRDSMRRRGIGDNLGTFGEVPARLDYMMVRRFGRLWHRDLRVRTIFWSHFKVGKIRVNAKLPAKPGEMTV